MTHKSSAQLTRILRAFGDRIPLQRIAMGCKIQDCRKELLNPITGFKTQDFRKEFLNQIPRIQELFPEIFNLEYAESQQFFSEVLS